LVLETGVEIRNWQKAMHGLQTKHSNIATLNYTSWQFWCCCIVFCPKAYLFQKFQKKIICNRQINWSLITSIHWDKQQTETKKTDYRWSNEGN